jgi:hypothetical protein
MEITILGPKIQGVTQLDITGQIFVIHRISNYSFQLQTRFSLRLKWKQDYRQSRCDEQGSADVNRNRRLQISEHCDDRLALVK